MENPNTTENATEATTPATETAAEKPVKQQRMLPPENKVLFETLRVKVWGKDVPLTDLFRERSVTVDGVELTLCSNDAGGGCAEEVEAAAETRPSLVLKGERGFFVAPLCAKCAQAVGHFRYEIRRNVANDEKHPRCRDARRVLSHTVVCKGKVEAEARLAELSAPRPDPKAAKDAAFASLVEYFRALRTEERFTRGGEEMVRVRMSDEVMLPLASSKRPGAYFGKCVPMSPKSYFGAYGVVRFPNADGWKVILLTTFELSALKKAGAQDLLFNGWLYGSRDDEEVTGGLEDKLFREAEMRALELTQKGEEGVRKADRQARFEARKAGGGNRGNGGGGGGGQGRETKVAAPQPQAAVSVPQADPIAIAADADKTRARERHAERKERRGDGEGKPGRRNGQRSDEDGVEFRQEMELEGSRRGKGRKNRGNEQDDRSWAEHTSAGNGSAKLGDQFGSLLSKVPVAPGPNGQ